MANAKQLDILKQGVEVWNQWRQENPEIQPDLAEADLSMTDLGGVDLSMTDLREVDLCGASLTFANLHGAKNLSQTKNLREADLGAAYLREADLRGVDLRGVNLRESVKLLPMSLIFPPSVFTRVTSFMSTSELRVFKSTPRAIEAKALAKLRTPQRAERLRALMAASGTFDMSSHEWSCPTTDAVAF